MLCDVELVQMGPNGVIRIPNRFRYEGVPLRGDYVIPRLRGNSISMVPTEKWQTITEDCISDCKTAVQARNVMRAFRTWARVTIDRYGKFPLPSNVRQRGGLGQNVTLSLTADTLAIKPEAAFESTLEFVRATNAALEVRFPEHTSIPLHERQPSFLRAAGHLKSRASYERIARMSPQELEAFVRDCFWNMGYRCAQTGRIGEPDGGIDLIVCSGPLHPFPLVLAVEVKSHAGGLRPTDVKAVRDFFGAIQSHAVAGGVLITNSRFTVDARQFAEKHKQRLWLRDIDDLVRWSHSDFGSPRFLEEVSSELHLRKGVAFSTTSGLVRRRWNFK